MKSSDFQKVIVGTLNEHPESVRTSEDLFSLARGAVAYLNKEISEEVGTEMAISIAEKITASYISRFVGFLFSVELLNKNPGSYMMGDADFVAELVHSDDLKCTCLLPPLHWFLSVTLKSEEYVLSKTHL